MPILESPRRLSESMIWRLQRRYFSDQGVTAFSSSTVPHYITSNAAIAEAYARMVVAYLIDQRDALDPAQPVHLVELGAGSGRFAFQFLQRFVELLPRAGLEALRFTYVLTDFSESCFGDWLAHPGFAPYLADGRLDVGRFDAEHDERIELRRSGLVLQPGALPNPLVVLANYFFDGIVTDVFTVRGGVLHEAAASVVTEKDEPDLDDPKLLERIRLDYEERSAATDYYGDPELDRLLEIYRERIVDSAVRIPIGALRCCQRLRRLAAGRWLLLSGDKGIAALERLDGQKVPTLALHGSFSLSVNYHALGEWFAHHGGEMLAPDHPNNSLAIIAAFDEPSRALPSLRLAYHALIEQFGPDDYFVLRRAVEANVEAHPEEMPLDALLALLRLGRGEPRQLQVLLPTLRRLLPKATPAQRHELERMIDRCWRNYFYIGESRDFAASAGVLHTDLGNYERAITFFEQSLRWDDESPSTHYNLALCHRRSNRIADARRHARLALKFDEGHAGARRILDDLPLVE